MKKILCVLLSVGLLFSMTACGKRAQPKNYENTKAAAPDTIGVDMDVPLFAV